MTLEEAVAAIPDAVRRRITELAGRQGALALSPVEQDADGRTVMCAATCVAYGVLDSAGDAANASALLTRLAADRANLAPVEEVLATLGWPSHVSQAMRELNDRMPPAKRLDWFVGLCS